MEIIIVDNVLKKMVAKSRDYGDGRDEGSGWYG